MLSDTNTANKQPQLSNEIQAKIGQQLRKIYDDMVTQGVPDRFVELLDQLEAPNENERSKGGGTPNPKLKHSNKESR